MTDFFSTSMERRSEPSEEQLQEIYMGTAGARFDAALADTGFVSYAGNNDWCVHSWDHVYGYMVLDHVPLLPLDDMDTLSNVRHIRAIATHPETRGAGIWSMVLTKMMSLAHEYGVVLHGISYPFLIEFPEMKNKEDFFEFRKHEEKYFRVIPSWTRQKKESKALLKKYVELGFCRFKYPKGNGFQKRWARDNLGFICLPEHTEPRVYESLLGHVSCA
jgi:GNAT superfamily N-acetyltransferase